MGFGGKHGVRWKTRVLVENMGCGEKHGFWWKTLGLVENTVSKWKTRGVIFFTKILIFLTKMRSRLVYM